MKKLPFLGTETTVRGLMLVLNKTRLHLFLLDAWDVSFPLLPACIAFNTDFPTLLEVFCTITIPMMEQAVVARLVNAAGVLSFWR